MAITTLHGLPIALDFAPMEAKPVAALPTDRGWRFEPKWDEFLCLAFRSGEQVELRAKSGKPLGRHFPAVVSVLRALPIGQFILDGELMIPVNGALPFDALEVRLHPAESRVRTLAAETPATLVLFDCLMDAKGRSLVDATLTDRRAAFKTVFRRFKGGDQVRLSPGTGDPVMAQAWLSQTGAALDGVVAKRRDGPYVSGERAMLKIKRRRTADCFVGGFRYEKDSCEVGSLLLGLYDDTGKLDHVGYTSAISDAERPALDKAAREAGRRAGLHRRRTGRP